MVVLECIVFGSLAAVVVSELYILKKLFTEKLFTFRTLTIQLQHPPQVYSAVEANTLDKSRESFPFVNIRRKHKLTVKNA